MIQIAPSILSADFTRIADAVKMAEDAGADIIHVDVMDGHFVPNLTLGPELVASLKDKTTLPLDVHLMVEKPELFIPLFQKAGADWISIHIEASVHLQKDIISIKEKGQKAGLALNPATPIHLMNEIIQDLDFVLLMTVNPGWGGQGFIQACHKKISHLKNWLTGQKLEIPIQVDGGIKLNNLEEVIQDGADIIVMGSGIYKEENPPEVIKAIKSLAKKYEKP
ncbi:MAG TPA: ribulose-phosphate 3-epimerase [Candidatus Heimdallarchaeota archaeon]|nr:ribulose-phosphate 3-epimerase [Candidatus Heimdallarchaeota archaeon]